MVRDQLVHGTVIPGLRERLLLEGSQLTLQRAMEIGLNMEGTFVETQNTNGANDEHEQVFRVAKGNKFNKNKPRGQASPSPAMCYRCGSEMHMANSITCKTRDQMCRSCGKIVHFARMCRRTGGVRAVAEEAESRTTSESLED